jgi:hypothetical protein
MSDHERKAIEAGAPYFHVLDGTAELQAHRQPFTCSRSQNINRA